MLKKPNEANEGRKASGQWRGGDIRAAFFAVLAILGVSLISVSCMGQRAAAAEPVSLQASTEPVSLQASTEPAPSQATVGAPGGKLMIYTEEQAATVCYIEPTEELRKKLSPEEYDVLVQAATEPPFQNAFWNNHRAGIYVDKIDGSALFLSSTKFESGTGWPSFWTPIDNDAVLLVEDLSYGMNRIEVRAKKSGGHLGHLFSDGPKPSGLRYCINSASLDFIPVEEMKDRGYGAYLDLLKK